MSQGRLQCKVKLVRDVVSVLPFSCFQYNKMLHPIVCGMAEYFLKSEYKKQVKILSKTTHQNVL